MSIIRLRLAQQVRLHHYVLVVAAFAYLATIADAPQPGYPSHWLLAALGDTTLSVATAPTSSAIVQLLDHVPVSTLSARASFLNAVWALLLLLIFHHIIRRVGPRTHNRERMAAFATLFLALSPGLWWAAVRPGPAPLTWLMLLGTVALISTIHRAPRTRTAFIVALVLGWASVESVMAAVAAFPLLLLTVAACRNSRHIAKWMAGAFSGFLLGAALALGVWLMITDKSVGIATLARAWMVEASMHIAWSGWLAVTSVSLGALALSANIWLRPRKRTRVRTSATLLALLAGLIALFALPPHILAPFQPVAGRLILPWILLAMAFGFSAAYLAHRLNARTWAALPVLMIVAIALWHGPDHTARTASAFQPLWDQALVDMREDDWLVSSGRWEAPLQLAARAKGYTPLFIRPDLSAHKPYRSWLAARMPDSHRASLALVSPRALIAERLQSNDAYPRIVFLDRPDAVVRAGRTMHPQAMRYDVDAGSPRVPTTFWQTTQPMLQRHAQRQDAYGQWAREMQAHLSRLANNLGVVLEHGNRVQEAQRCYEQALAFHTDNLSARINRNMLIHAHLEGADMEARIRRACGPDLPGRLAHEGGFIHQRRALYWIADLCGLRPHDDLPPDTLRDISRAYLAGKLADALQRAEAATQRHPGSRAAWTLFGVLAFEADDEQRLRTALDRMERRDERWAPLVMALGRRAMERGEYKQAADFLEEAHGLWPSNLRILESLIQLDLHLDNAHGLETRMRQVLTVDPWNPWANFALGVRHFQLGEMHLAEAALRRAIGGRPFPLAYNNLAWILYEQGALDDAHFYARRAVELDPAAFAHWHTLGAVLTDLKAWDAAGDALHTALRLNPESAEVQERIKTLNAR